MFYSNSALKVLSTLPCSPPLPSILLAQPFLLSFFFNHVFMLQVSCQCPYLKRNKLFSSPFELRAYILSHSTSPFFVKGFFQDTVSQTICLCWLQTMILLISASRVARIIDMSLWLPACLFLGCFCFYSAFFYGSEWVFSRVGVSGTALSPSYLPQSGDRICFHWVQRLLFQN
jgi:hypothetical protein